MNLPWSEDRVRQLKELNADGLSASQIARALGGGISRNAVIGKLSRLGLALMGSSHGAARATPRIRHVPVAARPKPVREPPPLDEPISLRVSILDIASGMCRWPHGEPTDLETFHFCGHLTELAHVYCPYHERRAAGASTAQFVSKWNLHGRRAA